MIFDTTTKEGMVSSLSTYLDISEGELYQYIDYAAEKARKDGLGLNTEVFQEELLDIFSDLSPEEMIDEIYVYHLSRRLDEANTDFSSANLKTLLLSDSPISHFLEDHKVTFIEKNGHPVVLFNGREIPLNNTFSTEVCYLRSRLGYSSRGGDYCFNGFAFRDLLMKNTYTRALYHCPEFIDNLSRFLKKTCIQQDYFKKSTYHCMTYKLKIEDILFDGHDQFDDSEKIDYFLTQLCLRLLSYRESDRKYMFDDDNPIIRIADDAVVSAECLVFDEVISLEMIE